MSEQEAENRTQELYEEIRGRADVDDELDLNKLWLMLGHDSKLLEMVAKHTQYMYNGGSLPFELKSKMSLVGASVMECEACRFFHESALENIGIDDDTITELEALEIQEAEFTPTEEVILKFTQKATEDPHSITDEDLASLREIGLSEQELLEVFDCIALHVYMSTIQAISGIVYPGMSREQWTAPVEQS